MRMQEEDLGTLIRGWQAPVGVEQIEGLDRTLIDDLGSQSHLSSHLLESQSDVEVVHQMEGNQAVRGRREGGQGGLLCEKRVGMDHCPPGKEEKCLQTGTGEAEGDPLGAVEPRDLPVGDL